MKIHEKRTPSKAHNIPVTNPKKKEFCDLPNKEFKIMIIKMLSKFRGRMDEHSQNFNKEFKDIEEN